MNENTSAKSNPLAMNVSASIQIQVHSQHKTQHSVSRALGILHSIVLIRIGYKKFTFMITFGVCRTQALYYLMYMCSYMDNTHEEIIIYYLMFNMLNNSIFNVHVEVNLSINTMALP